MDSAGPSSQHHPSQSATSVGPAHIRTSSMSGSSTRKNIIFYPGMSQYATGGTSACGLAAMNAVRLILGMERNGWKGKDLVAKGTSQETMEDILSICNQWTASSHLEVNEDIFPTPLFQSTLYRHSAEFYGAPSATQFHTVLVQLRECAQGRACGVVITRPPEVVSCLFIPSQGRTGEIFLIFDSHPRKGHPDGAAFIVTPYIDDAASELGQLFAVDQGILADSKLQWEVQLLTQFTGQVFRYKQDAVDHPAVTKTYIATTMSMLKMKAEINGLKQRLQSSQSDIKTLERLCKDQQRQIDSRVCSFCTSKLQELDVPYQGSQPRASSSKHTLDPQNDPSVGSSSRVPHHGASSSQPVQDEWQDAKSRKSKRKEKAREPEPRIQHPVGSSNTRFKMIQSDAPVEPLPASRLAQTNHTSQPPAHRAVPPPTPAPPETNAGAPPSPDLPSPERSSQPLAASWLPSLPVKLPEIPHRLQESWQGWSVPVPKLPGWTSASQAAAVAEQPPQSTSVAPTATSPGDSDHEMAMVLQAEELEAQRRLGLARTRRY